MAIQATIEARYTKQGLLEKYNAEMTKMIDAGVVTRLIDQEMRDWKGGVHYMSHFPVVNPDSSSTKLRIVMDLKMKNNNSGLSFNDLVEPVPNALSEILVVLARWRMKPVALNYDLSKTYHSLKTGPREKHLRRFLFRLSSNESWEVYRYDAVAFGDRPTAVALELAKTYTSKLGKHVDAKATLQLVKDSFVEDCGGGGTQEEVNEEPGSKMEHTGPVSRLLAMGGFKAKTLVPSFSDVQEEIESLSNKFQVVLFFVSLMK